MNSRSRLYFERKDETIDIQAKRKIISAGGIVGQDPITLSNNLHLVDDLLYDDRKYQQLCNLLQKLVLNLKPSASLKCSDVAGCEIVGDVVDLIGRTINGD